jgi:hypothetical protein
MVQPTNYELYAIDINSGSIVWHRPLDQPGLAQLQQLAAREQAIATAVDNRYARLVPAVTSSPVFDGDLLAELQSVIVDHGTGHTASWCSAACCRRSRPPRVIGLASLEVGENPDSVVYQTAGPRPPCWKGVLALVRLHCRYRR